MEDGGGLLVEVRHAGSHVETPAEGVACRVHLKLVKRGGGGVLDYFIVRAPILIEVFWATNLAID